MIKWSFAVVLVIAVLAAGAAVASDQQVTLVSTDKPVLLAQQIEPSTAEAEEPVLEERNRKPPHVFGLAVGSYTPLNSDVKDTFGGTKLRVGLRPLLTETPERMRLMYDVSFYALTKDKNQAILIPLTVGMLKGFGQETKTQTYAAINAGVFYGNVDALSVGVRESGWGFTANATVGLIYNKRLSLEARYEIMDEFAGFEFDSLSFLAAYKLLQWRF